MTIASHCGSLPVGISCGAMCVGAGDSTGQDVSDGTDQAATKQSIRGKAWERPLAQVSYPHPARPEAVQGWMGAESKLSCTTIEEGGMVTHHPCCNTMQSSERWSTFPHWHTCTCSHVNMAYHYPVITDVRCDGVVYYQDGGATRWKSLYPVITTPYVLCWKSSAALYRHVEES